MQQRAVLKHMGITVWQRHIPGQLVSATLDTQIESTPVPESGPVPESVTAAVITSEATTGTSKDQPPVPAAKADFPPATFDELLAMTVAADQEMPADGKILVLCPPQNGMSTGSGLSDDALRLLQKMMAAIELAAGDWSWLSLSTVTQVETVSATSVQQLLARQRIPALLLLLPEQKMVRAQQELNMACDQRITADVAIGSGRAAEPVLAGRLPSSRSAFCCLHHPQDLLANGALKRDAWSVLKALHKCLSAC